MSAPRSPSPWRHTTSLAIAAAILLVVAGIGSAWLGEQDFRNQRFEGAAAGARVLAATASAALAFDDRDEAGLAIDALKANPQVGALAIYAADGSPFVARTGSWGDPPARLSGVSPKFNDHSVVAVAPIHKGDLPLGWAYFELGIDDGVARWVRYAGVALLLGMAGLLIGAIAVGQRALSRANGELEWRAKVLSEANEQLVRETTERQKAEQSLVQAQKMEAIGQLTGGLAHDFNNLLAAVSGGVRLMERTDDRAKRTALRSTLDDAIQRGARLTRQLLSFARKQSQRAVVFEPCARLEAISELLQRTLGEDVGFVSSFPADRWRVMADPDQFELAILNLAVNARDAMQEGGRLTISCENVARIDISAREFVRVALSDTGSGMSQETIDHAFEPFFTTKDIAKGSGLGLAQVYAFARNSEGRAWIESAVGFGTTVYIELPRTLAQPDAEQGPSSQARLNPGPAPTGGGRRILIVEDDDAVANVALELLASHDYACQRVSSGSEGLGAIENAKYDLLFSDIVMPGGMSGIDLARAVRKRWPNLSILLTTGFAGKGDMAPGEFRIVNKPWQPDDLLRAVHSEIEGAARNQSASSPGNAAPAR